MLRPFLRLTLFVAALAPVVASGKTSGPLINDHNEVLVMSDGKTARLQKNPNARNPTLARLLAFIAENKVNRQRYVAGRFMCTEYAVSLHDRAEANGIHCGLVVLTFTEGVGHALNVFQTTDHGLVYVDCTGSPHGDADDAYDTIGYIEVGKKYGRLNVNLGAQWGSNYKKYEEAVTVFRNMTAWEKELSTEYAAIANETKLLKNPTDVEAEDAAVANFRRRKAVEALQERIEKYNRLREYRNEFAKTFRQQYGENTAPVARVDVFW